MHQQVEERYDPSSSTDLRTVALRFQTAGSSASCRVAPFEFVNAALGLVFRVVHRLADLLTPLSGLLSGGFLMRFMDLRRGVLGIAPGFLRRAFGLIDHAFVGQLLAANAFSDTLLHFSHCLSDLAPHLILIHSLVPPDSQTSSAYIEITLSCVFLPPAFSRRVVSCELPRRFFSSSFSCLLL